MFEGSTHLRLCVTGEERKGHHDQRSRIEDKENEGSWRILIHHPKQTGGKIEGLPYYGTRVWQGQRTSGVLVPRNFFKLDKAFQNGGEWKAYERNDYSSKP